MNDEAEKLKTMTAIFNGMAKACKVCGDEDYAEYLAFMAISRRIKEKHGPKKIAQYLNEAEQLDAKEAKPEGQVH